MSGEFFYCINILFTEKKRDRVRSVLLTFLMVLQLSLGTEFTGIQNVKAEDIQSAQQTQITGEQTVPWRLPL